MKKQQKINKISKQLTKLFESEKDIGKIDLHIDDYWYNSGRLSLRDGTKKI